MTDVLLHLPTDNSGGAVTEANIFATLKKLIAMEKKDLAIIANPTKYLAKGDFNAVIQAFAQLSGYINGTDPEWSILKGALNTKETGELKDALKTTLQQYNDVKIPVGKDSNGNTVYARVYTDPSHKTPATAWDFVKDWMNTGASSDESKITFYFHYNDKNLSSGHTAWTGNDNFTSGAACGGGSSDKSPNPTNEAGGGIHVHEDDAGRHCRHTDCNSYDCSGDAQAIAGFCKYSNDKNPNYNGSAAFDKYLENAGLGFNL